MSSRNSRIYENIPLAQTVLQMMHPLISAKNISVWSKLREKLFSAKDQGFDYCRNLAVASRAHFPEQEKLQGLRIITLNYKLCTLINYLKSCLSHYYNVFKLTAFIWISVEGIKMDQGKSKVSCHLPIVKGNLQIDRWIDKFPRLSSYKSTKKYIQIHV